MGGGPWVWSLKMGPLGEGEVSSSHVFFCPLIPLECQCSGLGAVQQEVEGILCHVLNPS